MVARNATAVALATASLLVTMWIVVPAPALPLLAFAVLVPEAAPLVAAIAFAIAIASYGIARGRGRRLATTIAIAALVCALVPIVEFPFARADAERRIDARFGAPRHPVRTVSAADLARVIVSHGVRVETRDGARLAIDVYRSTTPGARPTIVSIYGGGWRFGDPSQMAAIDRRYAALGFTTIAIDYRHVPAFRFPTQLHDVEDALAAIASHARAWNVDPARCALFGRSAGAQLALLAAYRPEPLRIRGVVAYYAPTDLARGYADPPFPDPANVRAIVRDYIGRTPDRAPAAYLAGSPIASVRAGLPPTLAIAGRRDALVRIEQQRALRDALEAHGDTVVAIELPWSNHVFDSLPSGLGATIATPATDRFLDAVLASP